MVVREDRDSVSSQEDVRPRRSPKSKRPSPERMFMAMSPVDHPMLAGAREIPVRKGGLDIFLDSFTNMCVPFACAQPREAHSKTPGTKVVYPVERFADYPALNAAHLIQQRRKDVRHQLFRPVSEDESSIPF